MMKTDRLLLILTLLISGIGALDAQSYASYTAEVEIGTATFYGDHLQGQTTSSGEAYRPDAFTAAHSSHPYGTMLRVTRLDNNESVEVRVNDRLTAGKESTCINLSRAAAAQLRLLAAGRAQVRVERIISVGANSYAQATSLTARSPIIPTSNAPTAYGQDQRAANPQNSWENQLFRDEKYAHRSSEQTTQSRGGDGSSARNQNLPSNFSWNDNVRARGANPAPASSSRQLPANVSGFAIQLASYSTPDNASSHAARLAQQGFDGAYVWQKDGRNRVVIAAFSSRAEATEFLNRLRQQHNLDGLVVSL